MTVKKITTNAEEEKRALVRSIAEAGRAGIKTRKESVQPNIDLAAAGKAAVSADPVDLGSAQTRNAMNISGAPAQDANRYAAATQAIFDGQRSSLKGTYTERFGTGHNTIVEATNNELVQYDQDLAAEEAARAAAAAAASYRSYGGGGGSRRSGGGGGSATDWDSILGDEGGGGGGAGSKFGDAWYGATGREPRGDDPERYNAPDIRDQAPIQQSQDVLTRHREAYAAAERVISDLYLRGGSFIDAIRAAGNALNRYKVPPADFVPILEALKRAWERQFAQHKKPVTSSSTGPKPRSSGIGH